MCFIAKFMVVSVSQYIIVVFMYSALIHNALFQKTDFELFVLIYD